MKSRSIKQKGKLFESLIRKKLLEYFPELVDEIRITLGQEHGSDLKLTKVAEKVLPLSIECKSRAAISCYTWYDQAKGHNIKLNPIVFIKQNRREPLVIIDADYFLELLKK